MVMFKVTGDLELYILLISAGVGLIGQSSVVHVNVMVHVK